MPKITVTINPVGETIVEGHDFMDSSCKSKMKPIEDALGGATQTVDKPEASIPAANTNDQHQSW